MHVNSDGSPDERRRRWRTKVWLLRVGLIAAVCYLLVAYLIAPLAWGRYMRHHPALDEVPGITQAGEGIPGDPINVALEGDETHVKKLLVAAGWYPVDPLTLRSCLEIAEASVLKRPYADAPVSSLYLWGRKEDLAFEQPVGNSPRKRHHVRWWRVEKPGSRGPLWVGSATFDERVGLSRTTGQITHHIAPDVDTERDHLFATFDKAGLLLEQYKVDDFHTVRSGRNGGGDPWHTDGRLFVGVIKDSSSRTTN